MSDAVSSKKLEIIAALVLGIATVAAAFAAYQSSLWSGNSLTNFIKSGNMAGEANREFLKGQNEISYETMIHLTLLKEEAADRPDEDFVKLLKKMRSLDLKKAVRWTDDEYRVRFAKLSMEEIETIGGKIAKLEEEMETLEGKIETTENEEEETKLTDEYRALEEACEKEYDKLNPKAFGESPSYVRSKYDKFNKMIKESQTLMVQGQKDNATGDTFTLLTVLFTVSLFFAGMASVLPDTAVKVFGKQSNIRILFLGLSILMFVYPFVRMLLLPFA
jgi:hypothetical protein